MTETEQTTETSRFQTCADWINIVSKLSEVVLPALKKFLRQCPLFHNKTTAAALVAFQMKELNHDMRKLLELFKTGFLSACESLTRYGTDESSYQAIGEDISEARGTKKLKDFLLVCNERLMSVFSCHNEACKATETMKQNLSNTLVKFSEAQNGRHFRSLVGDVAYGVGLLGVTTALLFASPITAPVAMGAVVATGATGVGGTLAGYFLKNFDKKEDLQVVSVSCKNIIDYLEIVHKFNIEIDTCYGTAFNAAKDVMTTGFFEQCAPSSSDTHSAPRFKVNDIDDKNLHNASFMLNEFKNTMNQLMRQTSEVERDIENILAQF